MALVVLFGSLALVTLWACARDRGLIWVALWLLVNCGVSNIIQFGFVIPASDPLAMVAALKPGPFTFLESMTAIAAFCAWADHRHFSPWVARLLFSICLCNALSIMLNIALAFFPHPLPAQVFLYELATNLLYVAECLLALSAGIADGVRSGRFSVRPRGRRQPLKPHAARTKGWPW